MPELALLQESVARLHQVRRAAPLRADLDDALMLARRSHHCLPFDDVDADRLLHVNVGAGLDSRDHRQGVPVVRRRDQHDVEVFLIEHFPVIGVRSRFFLRRLPLGDHIGRVGQHSLVDVAKRHHFDRGHLDQPEQVGLTVPARADQADARRLIGEPRKRIEPGQRQPGGGAGGQKISAVHGRDSCV